MEGYYGEPTAPRMDPRFRRLIRGMAVVGYARELGASTFYSRDGVAFGGEAIPFDTSVPQTALRTRRNGRVYHLDEVLARRRGTSALQVARALEHPEHGTLLWWKTTGRIERAADALTSGRVVEDVVGVRCADATLRARVDGLLALWQPPAASRRRDAAVAALVLLAGVAAVAGPSYAWSGQVGALWPVLGGLLSTSLGLRWRAHRRPGWLSRDRLVHMAAGAGALVGPAGALAWATVPALPPRSAAQTAATGLALAVGAGLTAALVVLIAGDVAAYLGGGFAGEEPWSNRPAGERRPRRRQGATARDQDDDFEAREDE